MKKAMLALQGMADEVEREKARPRTYDAMQRKADGKVSSTAERAQKSTPQSTNLAESWKKFPTT
jgi:hypothetical protein